MDPTGENVSSFDGRDDSGWHSSDDEFDDDFDDKDDGNDYDMAITHVRNAQLRDKPLVEKFFNDVSEHTSLADQRTRSWLGDLPFYMHKDAIPLFVDGDASEDDSKDYQLHPCYTFLELSKSAKLPHNHLLRLCVDGTVLDVPKLVIGIGRLFVNFSDGGAGRISKWTGYEVFADQQLALWMVFNRQSIYAPAADWYPLPCRLSLPNPQTSDDEQRFPSSRRFDIARFLPSLRDLADAKFETAIEQTQMSPILGETKVDQVEHSEVFTLLEADPAPQQAESTTMRKPVTMAADTVGSYHLEQRLWEAVKDSGSRAQKIADLLDSPGENAGEIEKLITKQVVIDAAGNEACGMLIMSRLLDLFQGRVHKTISTEVVKTAAGNRQVGAQIMARLLEHFKDAVCENLSCAALCQAAENEPQGAEILGMLLDADANAVKKAFRDVEREAEKGSEWCAKVLPDLKRMMGKPSGIPYMATSGGQVGTAPLTTEPPHGFKVENA